MQTKIKSFEEIVPICEVHRKEGKKVIHCHGVFDLLHPGHIRHFKTAKEKGDALVVTVTSDRFVNKGPGRPAFTEALRIESIAALQDVDYVVLNDAPDAILAIEKIKPAYYVKGVEYQSHDKDVTGKIAQEVAAVEASGGQVYYTEDIVFSSSSLLNRYFDSMPPQVLEFIQQLKKKHSLEEIVDKINALSKLRVLLIGDAIIDLYQYTEALGQSGKGLHMVARNLNQDVFLGGSLIIANHLASFAGQVTLLTALGKKCPYLSLIEQNLDPKVNREFVYLDDADTLVKKRYVLKDGKTLSKLFETYSGQEKPLNEEQTNFVTKYLKKHANEYDLVLVADFGNGFTNFPIINAISDISTFLALNTQTNSGNRGYNVVTSYQHADYISLNEPELRLSTHDRTSSLEGVVSDICQIMHCQTVSITRGVKGVFCLQVPGTILEVPALATNSVDRIGAGDSYLSLSSLCLAKGYSPLISAFIGSIAAAMNIQFIGNQEAVKKVPLCKFITRLMK